MTNKTIIIVGGGSGSRMGSAIPKQFLTLGGEPVLARTVRVFSQALPDAALVVALPGPYESWWKELCSTYRVPTHSLCHGGATRFESVRNALAVTDPETEWIGVHDAVRPLVSLHLIRFAFEWAERHGSAIPAVLPVDSFRMIDDVGSHPVDRNRLRAVQTPQVFRADLLRETYRQATRTDFTDDASVVESAGYAVSLCEGERTNLKLTTPSDLLWAETFLKQENNGQ